MDTNFTAGHSSIKLTLQYACQLESGMHLLQPRQACCTGVVRYSIECQHTVSGVLLCMRINAIAMCVLETYQEGQQTSYRRSRNKRDQSLYRHKDKVIWKVWCAKHEYTGLRKCITLFAY